MRVAVAALIALLLVGVLGGLWVIATEEPPAVEPTAEVTAAEGVVEAVGEFVVDDYGIVRDERGRRVTFADGTPLPEGARLDEEGRIVLADGRVLGRDEVRSLTRRAERRLVAGADLDAPERGERERLVVEREGGGDAPERELTERERTIARLRPGVTTDEEGSPTLESRTDWEKAEERITTDTSTRPALDVEAPPPTESTKNRTRRTEERSEAQELQLAREHGLRADYYDFLEGELRTVPELAELPPSFTRIDRNIDFTTDDDFALPFHPDTFGVLWRGRLLVPQDGEYEFVCGSDDGVRLRIGGTDVIAAPHLRAYAESRGSITLTAGAHDFELTFYENWVFASCRLFWSGPGMKQRVIAPRYFAPPEDLAEVVRPHITRISPERAFIGDTVIVRGTGFSAETAFVRVTFDGVPGKVVSATDSQIEVEVPIGAATGDVVAQVGAISSLPEPFEVRNLIGLHAEYFRVGNDLRDYPDFDAMAPYFIRLDGPIDFHRDDLWRLPYEPDVFAARYTGYLYIPADDDYEITLGSDDGARLSIGGEPYIDMPGLHAYEESSRRTRFTEGFHPLELIFFENRGVARLRLFWQRAGDVTRTLIPRGFLFAPEDLARRPAPRLQGVTPSKSKTEGSLVLTGSGFGDDARYVRVEFPGGVWVRPTAITDSELTCTVPFATESGDVRVHVGVRTSRGVPFRLDEPVGLRADYYQMSNEAAVLQVNTLADLEGLVPTTTRVETDWRRHGNADWNLPFAPDHFVVHWHGMVHAEQVESLWWIVQARDGASLSIDGQRIVGIERRPSITERSGRTRLSRGEHRIDLIVRHTGDDPRFHLFWTRDGQADHHDVPRRWFRPTPDDPR